MQWWLFHILLMNQCNLTMFFNWIYWNDFSSIWTWRKYQWLSVTPPPTGGLTNGASLYRRSGKDNRYQIDLLYTRFKTMIYKFRVTSGFLNERCGKHGPNRIAIDPSHGTDLKSGVNPSDSSVGMLIQWVRPFRQEHHYNNTPVPKSGPGKN